MKLIKLEVYTDSDREKTKTIVLNPNLISSAALHPHEKKPEVVLSDYQTSFFLTPDGVKTLLGLKNAFVQLLIWENDEKLTKLAFLVNPNHIAYLDVVNGFDKLFLMNGDAIVLTDEAVSQVMKHV